MLRGPVKVIFEMTTNVNYFCVRGNPMEWHFLGVREWGL